MAEFTEGPLGREPLFLRAYDMKKLYGLDRSALLKAKDHLHHIDLVTGEAPLRLISTVYMETMSRYAGRLGLGLSQGIIEYFATTEDAHHAITYTETRFKNDLAALLLEQDAEPESERLLPVTGMVSLLEIGSSTAKHWVKNEAFVSTVTSAGACISEKDFQDFCQWQRPVMYDPAATVRNL